MVSPEGVASRPGRRDRARCAATLSSPLPSVLVLPIAYLMREILLLLYVSALFAVVLTPLIRGIMRIHVRQLASRPRAGDLFPVAQRGRRRHPVFCFRPARRYCKTCNR